MTSDDTAEPRIAVLVIAHANPASFANLVRALSHPRIQVVAHVDVRVDQRAFQTDATSDVVFVTDRIANFWADWSQIEVALRLMRTARSIGRFASHALISGDTLPLVTTDALVRTLAATPTMTMLQRIGPDTPYHKRVSGIFLPRTNYGRVRDGVHFLDRCILPEEFDDYLAAMRTAKAKREFTFTVWRGRQWIALSDRHVTEIEDLMDRDPAFVDIFRYSLIPDALFFQTALKLVAPKVPPRPGFMGWDWPTGPSPKTLTDPAELDTILSTRALFFRKFSDSGPALAEAVLAGRRDLEAARAEGWPVPPAKARAAPAHA
ncbi:beta-1,6-N-acetylglucosaminyltransferase [Falsiroseomonas sp. HW251]|uniref:beta-1,6-N-acetylglucosaminyltransferase n=1 Tax=Falsiroseomonas sp. HW251 TaxID=3390998 RepID=UPI003D31A2FE